MDRACFQDSEDQWCLDGMWLRGRAESWGFGTALGLVNETEQAKKKAGLLDNE